MTTSRLQRRLLEKENAKQPATLAPVPRHEWPNFGPRDLREVWRSRFFLVQVYGEPGGYERISVSRTTHNGDRWDDNITWEELMSVKRQCGRGSRDALEVYPADQDVVNVANMRHLFLPPEPVSFAWRASGLKKSEANP